MLRRQYQSSRNVPPETIRSRSQWVTVRVQVAYEAATPVSHPVAFEIDALDSAVHLLEKSVFMVPRQFATLSIAANSFRISARGIFDALKQFTD